MNSISCAYTTPAVVKTRPCRWRQHANMVSRQTAEQLVCQNWYGERIYQVKMVVVPPPPYPEMNPVTIKPSRSVTTNTKEKTDA